MSTTFKFTSPVQVGSISNPTSISSLCLTALNFSSTPELAPIGTGTLSLTLTDPQSGFQETITYGDASVLTLWAQIEDTVAQAVFAKLIADAKLPAGTVSVTANDPASTTQTPNTLTTSGTSIQPASTTTAS